MSTKRAFDSDTRYWDGFAHNDNYYIIRGEYESDPIQQFIVDKCDYEKSYYDKCIKEHKDAKRRERNRQCARFHRIFMACVQDQHKVVTQKHKRWDFNTMEQRRYKKKFLDE